MHKLRFHNDDGSPFETPDELTIQDLFDKVRATNKDGSNKNVITNSAEHGLIPQRDFFDKDIAVEGNTNKYTIIKDGDFVYNPRKSSTAPYGPFNCYTRSEPGIVSPLYSCLTPKNKEYTPYLLYYFASPAWYSYIYHNGNQGGARHDRVGMTDDLLQGIPVSLPCMDEQNKITTFLSLYDKRIAMQSAKVDALESRRKGILQKIFSQEIRFKKANGEDFPDWEDTLLSDLLTERKMKSTGNEEVYSVSVAKGLVNQIEHLGRSFAAEDTSKYKVVKPGDVVYTKSPTGDFKWGIVKQSMIDKDVIVSPLYGIFIPRSYAFGFILDAYFSSSVRAHNYLITQIRKGAKNTINITNDVFLEKEIFLPTSEEEAVKIQQFVELLDKQIDIEKEKLEAIKLIKKGLLQQLFM